MTKFSGILFAERFLLNRQARNGRPPWQKIEWKESIDEQDYVALLFNICIIYYIHC